MKNSTKKYSKGFTLIEMLVTIAIVGIFASIAIPSFSKLIERNRITSGGNELVSNLLLARSEALKRRNTVTICPSLNPNAAAPTCNTSSDFSSGWIVFLDCDDDIVVGEAIADCGTNGTEDIIKVHDGFDSLFMTNRSVQKISFGFSGRLEGSTSTFDVGPGTDVDNSVKSVVLSRVGRVRTQAYVAPP